LFPQAITPAYAFQGVYAAHDTLATGKGYWMKFGSSQIVPIDGYLFSQTSAELAEGWNIVGSISHPLPFSSVTTTPPDILGPYVFAYNRGYFTADTLYPGIGYWVRADQAGEISFDATSRALPKKPLSQLLAPFNSITVSDGLGGSQTLYFGATSAKTAGTPAISMPPKAPEGSFDARFAPGSMLEVINNGTAVKTEYPINIQSASTGLTVKWKLNNEDPNKYYLSDENGKSYPLLSGGSITLAGENQGSRVLRLSYSSSGLPKEFALHQNYPNPFNPATRIAYELPVTGHVSIKIYNLLGNEVAVLADEVQEAGYRSVEFSSGSLPSGVYMCKMQTDRFTSVKKMILMK